MTIEHSEVIDFVGTDKVTGAVILTISDHLSWGDEVRHFQLIERKINRYLDFIRTGQIFETHPQAKSMPIQIKLIYQYEISESGSRFLVAAQKQLKERGVDFSYAELPAGY
jgi:hypothetical protein